MPPFDVPQWLDAYAEAWRSRDPDAAAALFTEDSIYRSHPFREAHRGQDGVRAYWAKATGDQRGLDLRFGTPVVEGDHVAVEWWAVMRVERPGEGEGVGTLPGCLFLLFAKDGRCRELREYWHWADEKVAPPEGWGR
jgi:hypothetical protein